MERGYLSSSALLTYRKAFYTASVGTVENHGKNWQKTRQTFVKIAKITAKTRHQITGQKTIIQSIKFNIQHCQPSLHAV